MQWAQPELMPTPCDVIARDGASRLLRFRAGPAQARGLPLVLVPSMINRWYVLDLRRGSSLAAALVEAGLDVWCLDWGVSGDEDRYLEWDDVLARLSRALRMVRRNTGARRTGLLGYCMGGTLAGIAAALEPDRVAALVNLAGPFDFAQAGCLGHMVDPRWFDAEAIAEAGNVSARQMQSGFVALRPTAQLAKWVTMMDRGHDPAAREAFAALETWASDNVPFPAAAYVTYIRSLYQRNELVRGEHRVAGRRVELGVIRCPVMTVVAERDVICPPAAATALHDRCGSEDRTVLSVPGGHVGAVIGSRASKELYPTIARWLGDRLVAPQHESAEQLGGA